MIDDYENDDGLTEDELLNVPSDNVPALSRVWSMRSGAVYVRQMTELAAERAGNARPMMLFPDRDPRARHRDEEERRRALLAYQAAMEEVRDHADRLLLRIDEEQHQIEKRRTELEGRALHLHDGRRFWLDGRRFRDDDGVELQGRARVEAWNLAQEHPDAATWSERERIEEQMAQVAQLRKRVEAERDTPDGDPEKLERKLDDYEKELQAGIDQRHETIASSPADYDTDYMALTSTHAFNAAAPGSPVVEEVDDKNKKTETSSVVNRPVRIQAQGGPKPS